MKKGSTTSNTEGYSSLLFMTQDFLFGHTSQLHALYSV